MSNRFNQAETQSAAGAVAARFKPVESFGDIAPFVERNAGSPIGNGNDRCSADHFSDLDRDHAAIDAMLYGVIDEVGKRIKQKIAISDNDDWRSIGDIDRQPILFGSGLEQTNNLTREFRQIDRLKCGPLRLRLYARDPQERGKNPQYVVQFGNREAEQRAVSVWDMRLRIGLLQTASDPRQRGSEIVRDIVGDLSIGFH